MWSPRLYADRPDRKSPAASGGAADSSRMTRLTKWPKDEESIGETRYRCAHRCNSRQDLRHAFVPADAPVAPIGRTCLDARILNVTKPSNYIVRLHRPRAEILNGNWTVPQAQPGSEPTTTMDPAGGAQMQ